ncbi:MAG TPA: hypothetical protein ENJ95_21795 [Bacteroidetes bacterium]|nr:hypothetical protein [Bacteroidota bacterium]
MPELIIIAGANGVGKTTFARPYTKEYGYDFLNADDIAKEFEDRGEKAPLIKAGRIFFYKLNEFIESGKSFVVETTLSGSYINKVAERAIKNEYKIKLIYIFLDTPELCFDRVKMRVKKGGHKVPKEDIERRFYRSINNFWNEMKNTADEWSLLYNGEYGFQNIAAGEFGNYIIENEAMFHLYLSNLNKNES